MTSETTMKYACPIHPNRRLSDNGYCADCNSKWGEPVLRGYTLQYDWAKTDYEEVIGNAKIAFQVKVGKLREKAKEANKQFLEASE